MISASTEQYTREQFAVMDTADIDLLLVRQIEGADEQRILGQDPTNACAQAETTLEAFGRRSGWDVERQTSERVLLESRLQQPLTYSTYDSWLTRYAHGARGANDANNALEAYEQLGKSRTVLKHMADFKADPESWYASEVSILESYVSNLKDKPIQPPSSRPNRLKRLRASVAMLATAAFSKTVVTNSEVQGEDNQGSDAEQSKDYVGRHRRRNVIIGAAGAVAVAAVGAYLVSRGYIPGFGGSGHSALQGATDHGVPLTTSHATIPPDFTPQQSSSPHEHMPLHPPAQPIATQEALNTSGDTIWSHARKHVGKHATQSQVKTYVDKILESNHLTYAKAKLLQVGFKFNLPV